MSDLIVYTRPVKTAILGFLCAIACIAVLALMSTSGWTDTDVSRRMLGFVFGAMLILIGNLVPKLRPFTLADGHAEAAQAERFSGWILALSGVSYFVLFAFASVAQARHYAALLGFATLAVIAGRWLLRAKATWRGRREASAQLVLTKPAGQRRKLVGNLLFAVLYLLATASCKWLFDDQPGFAPSSTWMLLTFGLAYAIVFARLERKRRYVRG
jgi:uncharacterized membrane protein